MVDEPGRGAEANIGRNLLKSSRVYRRLAHQKCLRFARAFSFLRWAWPSAPLLGYIGLQVEASLPMIIPEIYTTASASEPLTPCLQNQKANLDDVGSDEKK
jgi:hypothetical protein